MGRDAFTLVEVVLALALAALGVTLAAAAFGLSIDAIADLEARAEARDRDANAWGWMGDALASIDVAPEPSLPFEGTSESLSFHTRLRVGDGWMEPGFVHLSYEPPRLVVSTDHGAVQLFDSVEAVAFDYLDRLGTDASWLTRWQSSITPPLAIRIRLRRHQEADTILFYIGARR
jgi:prepilin-type N-terminal cleavage/methylation domain-containing protein